MGARSTRVTYTVAGVHVHRPVACIRTGAVREGEGRTRVATGIFSTRAIAVPKTRPQRVRFVQPRSGMNTLCSVSDDLGLVDVPLSDVGKERFGEIGIFTTRVDFVSCANLTGSIVINNEKSMKST